MSETTHARAFREGKESFHDKIVEIAKGIAHIVRDQDHRQNFKWGVDEAYKELIQHLAR